MRLFLTAPPSPGKFVRILPGQPVEWPEETPSIVVPTRTRRTHFSHWDHTDNTSDMPPDMRQAFLMLANLAKRRSPEEINAMSVPAVEVLLERLEKEWAEIDQEWRSFRSTGCSETVLERIGCEYMRPSDMYMELKAILRARLSIAQSIGWTTTPSSDGAPSLSLGAMGQTIQIQIAEPINIPRFSGRDEDWALFRNTFVAEVHSNVRLNNPQKKRHLLNVIDGRARNILGNWSPDCGESYEQAWQGLCNAYDNEYNTVQAHMRKIDALRPIQRPTCSAIREVLDTTRSAHRQLGILLTKELMGDHLVIHRVEQLLDAESRAQWALRRLPNALPTLEQMFGFLEIRATALLDWPSRPYEQNTRSGPPVPATARGNEPRPNCRLCPGERHWPFKCTKFRAMPLSERWAHVNERRMCGNCFSFLHKTKDCPDSGCPRCHTPHNSSSCSNNNKIERRPIAHASRRTTESSSAGTAAGANPQRQ